MHNTPDLKGVLKWGRIVLVVLAIFLGIQAVSAFGRLGDPDPYYNSISVTGEGEAIAIPDTATFSFSVSADGQTATDAQTAVTNKMNPILEKLETLGVAEKDVKTTDYSVYPKYRYETQPASYPNFYPSRNQIQDGFTASHSVRVKIRDTGRAGEALSAVGELGATNISGVSFTVDDEDAVVEEARMAAIKKAREKAKALAKELDVRIVRVVSFYDNYGGYPVPYATAEAGYGGDAQVRTISTPNVPTGENKITASITVVFEIR